MNKPLLSFIALLLVFASCEKDTLMSSALLNDSLDGPTPYYLPTPIGSFDRHIPDSNPLTEEGIDLGRKLFYDPILSREMNISCSSCHQQEHAFSDPRVKSIGTHGKESSMHSMALFNLAPQPRYFWNGRSPTLEDQAFHPVVNPLEMDMTWPEVVERLKKHDTYPKLFREAFGDEVIDSVLVAKAIAQFEYTIISLDSKFDKVSRGEAVFTNLENDGRDIFTNVAHCDHCHLPPSGSAVIPFRMSNNGLDDINTVELGYKEVTGSEWDLGKFKAPSLRNIVFTAPYMHDGRFNTLDEVLEFYSTGLHSYDQVDPDMEFAATGGVKLNPEQRKAITAFILTLTDSSLITNEEYANPFSN